MGRIECRGGRVITFLIFSIKSRVIKQVMKGLIPLPLRTDTHTTCMFMIKLLSHYYPWRKVDCMASIGKGEEISGRMPFTALVQMLLSSADSGKASL